MYEQPVFPTGLIASSLVITVIAIIAMWKIFQKAGQPGWAAIIPVYNIYILLKIVGKPTWWLLLLFIPLVNIVIGIWITNMLSKSFGKDEAFTAGLILLGFIFYPILGFGSAVYLGPYGDAEAFRAAREHDRFDFEKDNQ